MEEEGRCQEVHRLCANNCGFFGSPATLDLCSKCYRDRRLKEDQDSSAKIAIENSIATSPPSSSAVSLADLAPKERSVADVASAPVSPADLAPSPSATAPPARSDGNGEPQPPPPRGRCSVCAKKVGLTGFRCRCGETFCGTHRYPERHGCGFDFKAAGREAIARANPAVKADKLKKI